MPKQVYKIISFHGGLATAPDPRDILDGQLVDATDIMVDNVGKIRTLGTTEAHDAELNDAAAWAGTLEAGKGLFYFSHDKTLGDVGGSSAADTGEDYLAMYDDDDGDIWIYKDRNSAGWGATPPISLGTGTPVFYMADGTLRVADATFIQNTKWYGYIKRTLWPSTTAGDLPQVLDGWFSMDNLISGPLHGGNDVLVRSATGSYGTGLAPQLTNNELGMVVRANIDDEGGWSGYLNYYSTCIYDNHQESLPGKMGVGNPLDSVWQNSFKKFRVMYHTNNGAIRNERETGARIYWRDVDSQYKPYGDLYLLFEVDFVHGVRQSSVNEWTPWDDNTEADAGGTNTEVVMTQEEIEVRNKPRTEVYGARSGYSSNLHSIDAKYKTAVVANRRTYIGNVEFTDEGGVEVIRGDAVLKSPVNAFDVFPATNILEAVVNDGDEIIKLESYADRLLQFKRTKLEILNISQNVEFLEDTFMHKGVSHTASVCKTDYGIAWVNEFGCYLYDGQKVNDLLEKGGIQVIKESEWAAFAGKTSAYPMIGYIPKKRQLLVTDDIGATGDGSIYIYDMVTKSWVKGSAGTMPNSTVKTNFVNDWNGDLVFAHTTGTPLKWNDGSAATGSLSLKTKDIDFGQPSIRKKIYKVYVSYKGDGSAITVGYGFNGDNDTIDGQFFRCNADGSTTGATSSTTPFYQGSVGTDDWINAELKPANPINNKYSFQLKFDGDTTDANFQINDISIIYRLKGVK